MASNRKENWQGMNWIRQEKRLAIYLRDGMACAYCGATVEDGAQLSLDHIQPYSQGGSNSAENLVTACSKCNSSRGDRPVDVFIAAVAAYINHGTTAGEITEFIVATTKRPLNVQEAKDVIARRKQASK